MDSMNALAFFDNFLNDRQPHGFSYNFDPCYVSLAEETPDGFIIKENNNWMGFDEFYARKAQQFYRDTLSQLNECINQDSGKLDFYVAQLRYFINRFKDRDKYITDTVEYLAIDALLTLANRYDFKLRSSDVNYNYILLKFNALYHESSRNKFSNLKSFFEQKGKVLKNKYVIHFLDDSTIWESIASSDFDSFYEKILISAYDSTCSKIDRYLNTLPDKYIDDFVTDLSEKIEARFFSLKYSNSFYNKELARYMESLLDKKKCPPFYEDYITRRKKRKDISFVDAFQWTGNEQEKEMLYEALIANEIIETDLHSFMQAFSSEPLFIPLKIKWLLKASKSKSPEIKSLFYFIKQLCALGKMSSDYNFMIKTAKTDSVKLYDQLCQIFIKCDGSEIDRSTVRNSSNIFSYSSPNSKKIDLALQTLTGK